MDINGHVYPHLSPLNPPFAHTHVFHNTHYVRNNWPTRENQKNCGVDNKDGVSACCFLQLFTLWRFKRKLCWLGHFLFVVATIDIFHSAILSGPSICALLFSDFRISAPSVTKILAFLLPIFFPPSSGDLFDLLACTQCLDISLFLSTMFSVWPHPFNDVTLLLLLLFQLFILLCFVSIFSVWRCPWAVLRPDEAF